MTIKQTDEQSSTLFDVWKLALEQAGYVCKLASEIADRDLLYDGLIPDQPAQVIGGPYLSSDEVQVIVNRQGRHELVSYVPEQVVFVKKEGSA